jgi:uncharacterized protein YqgV (UPF0045/DUF77 family)
MHTLPINASIQLVPINTVQPAMDCIDQAIQIIHQSGLAFEVGPFGTSVAGTHTEIMELVTQINSWMAASSPTEWLLNIQLHIHPHAAITMEQKTAKHR